MRKLLILSVMSLLFALPSGAEAVKFGTAFAQVSSKPMFVLVYANWASGYQNCLTNFRAMQKELGKAYNYVELDIAQADTAEFNKKFQIYQNLPYVIMFRKGGQSQRYVDNACTASKSCLKSKVKAFIN